MICEQGVWWPKGTEPPYLSRDPSIGRDERARRIACVAAMGFAHNMPPGYARVFHSKLRLLRGRLLAMPPAVSEAILAEMRLAYVKECLDDHDRREVWKNGV